MRKSILEFYRDKGFDIPKLILRKPVYLKDVQVEAGAVELYNQILEGHEIKNINISRRVYKLAETVSCKEFEQDQEILENNKEIIKRLKQEKILLLIWAFVMSVFLFFHYWRII